MYDSRGVYFDYKVQRKKLVSSHTSTNKRSLQSFFPPQAALGPLIGYLMKSGEFMYSLMADRFYREGNTQGS